MDQVQFASKFSSIQAKLINARNYYKFKTIDEVWSNIGTNLLDIALIELTSLYLESDSAQREFIFNHFANDELLNDLWYFVRRIGKQIHSKDDSKYLELGIAASLIDGGRADFRDLIVSLMLLRFAAEMQGIDTRPFFDGAIQNADEKIVSILTNVRDSKKADIHSTVQMFGEHTSNATDKKKARWGLREIITIILLIGLCILAIYIRGLISIGRLW